MSRKLVLNGFSVPSFKEARKEHQANLLEQSGLIISVMSHKFRFRYHTAGWSRAIKRTKVAYNFMWSILLIILQTFNKVNLQHITPLALANNFYTECYPYCFPEKKCCHSGLFFISLPPRGPTYKIREFWPSAHIKTFLFQAAVRKSFTSK